MLRSFIFSFIFGWMLLGSLVPLSFDRSQYDGFSFSPDTAYVGYLQGGYNGSLLRDTWIYNIKFPPNVLTYYKIEISSGNHYMGSTRQATYPAFSAYLDYQIYSNAAYTTVFPASTSVVTSRSNATGRFSGVVFIQVPVTGNFLSPTFYRDSVVATYTVLNSDGTTATDNFNQPLVFSTTAFINIYTLERFKVTYGNNSTAAVLDFGTVSSQAKVPFYFVLDSSVKRVSVRFTSTYNGMKTSAGSSLILPYDVIFNVANNANYPANQTFAFNGLGSSTGTVLSNATNSPASTVNCYLNLPSAIDFSRYPPGLYQDTLTVSFTQL